MDSDFRLSFCPYVHYLYDGLQDMTLRHYASTWRFGIFHILRQKLRSHKILFINFSHPLLRSQAFGNFPRDFFTVVRTFYFSAAVFDLGLFYCSLLQLDYALPTPSDCFSTVFAVRVSLSYSADFQDRQGWRVRRLFH